MNELEFPISLSKFISLCGVASRRKSTELIKAEKIKVNGEIIVEPGFKLKASDTVIYNGNKVTFLKRYYIALNKPTGYICTNEDKFAKKKAIDLIDIPEKPRLFTVGRLDKNSEGLIIITNDGEFAKKLTHPKHQVKKIYHVTTSSPISEEEIRTLTNGISDNGEFLKAQKIRNIKKNTFEFTLTQGKNREIRRMVSYIGKKTLKLKRIAIGNYKLPKELKQGNYAELNDSDINALLSI